MSNHTKVKQLPESERPYEKFLKYGVESLSDAELLAIILKSGTKDLNSLEIARMLLSGGHGNLLNLFELSFEEFLKLPGIGKVKAIQLKAVAELSNRIAKTNSGYHISMKCPSSIAAYYMESLRHLKKEFLICAFFDAKNTFLGDSRISIGSTSYAYVSPKDVFKRALEKNAVSIVIIHNHPSGDPSPSEDDILVTKRIREGAALLGIRLSDHIIIGDNRYFSFAENDI